MPAATQNLPSRQTLIRALIIGALSTSLVACGGGGPGGADLISGGSSGGGGGTATPAPTSAPIPAEGRVTLTPAQATLTLGQDVQVTALVVDANNKPVAGAVVNFATDAKLGLLRPSAGLTGADGKVITTLSVASVTASGNVGQLTVAASYKDANGAAKTANNAIAYQVGESTLKIDSISVGTPANSANISAYATTSISVLVSANGKPINGEIVKFSSQCAQSGKATIDATAVTNSSGIAIAAFTDKGCATPDTITASVASGKSATTTVAIDAPAATSLIFSMITPTDGLITLKGYASATRADTAQVQFKLVDALGNPLAGQAISFSLDGPVGGVALLNAVNGTTTATTDSNGIATAVVLAGTQPTPVRVTAKAGALVSTSGKLAISSGFPDQDSISIAADKHNINGWYYDGEKAQISMRFADHFNNPIPDGTAINFITDGGRIGSATQGSCTTQDSSCTITLESQNPRPSNGRVHIVAYAVGEESFVDKNNNIIADQDSELVDINGLSSDIGEAFIDVNENGIFDQGTDQLVDFNSDSKYNGPNGLYNGTLCATGFAKCSSQKTLNIFKQATFIFSSDDPKTPVITPAIPASLAGTCGTLRNFTAYIPDMNGNILPAGTKISFASTNGTGSVTAGASQTIASATPPLNAQVLNQTLFEFQFKFGATATPCPATSTGVLAISVDTPAGGGQAAKKTTFNYTYTIN